MEQTKNRWYSIVLIICVSLLIVCIPFDLFIKNVWILFIVKFTQRLLAIAYIVRSITKEKLTFPIKMKLAKKNLLLIPLLLLCFSNFFVVLFDKNLMLDEINLTNIVREGILCVLTAIMEELLFRGLLVTEFSKKQPNHQTIIYSALAFGSIHLLNIGSLASVIPCLVQVIYTAFLGLFLAFIYLSSKNLIYPIIFHFCFNFINDILVTNLYIIEWNLNYFIINIIVGIIALLYGFALFKFMRKDDLDATKNLDF